MRQILPCFLFCFLCLFAHADLQAQRPAAMVRKGEQAVKVQDYYTAIHYFQQALERKAAPDIRYRLAEAALDFKAYDLAIEHYLILLGSPTAAQYATAYLGLAQAQQAKGDYSAALTSIAQFRVSGTGSKQQNAIAEQLRLSCEWSILQQAEEDWELNRLGRRLNSPYAEFGPWKSGDTLYFSSYRFDKKDDNYTPARKVSKVLITKDEQRGRTLSRGFNEDTILTAHTAINTAGDRLFFSRCQFVAGAEISCRLCVREKDRRGRWNKAYQVLPQPVNLANHSSTQPAIMWDTLSGQEYLLFASNRPGGSGDFDIWQVAIPIDLKTWGEPVSLPTINTAAAEMTPYFSLAEQSLYFSTNRSPGFGGFDLGKSAYGGNGSWGEYRNLGAAINSSYDDTYPFFGQADQAYFSSNRPGGRYLDEESKTCCPDLFKARRIYPKEEIPLLDSIGESPTDDPLAEVPYLKPPPRTLEEFLPLTLYYDNDQPNPRTRRASTEKSYEETYFNYLRREDDYYEQFAEEEETQDKLAQFFEEEVSQGFEDLNRFSDILLEQLEADQTVEIFLKGYTSPRARGDYNLLLGKRRVSAVRNHFSSWKQGILEQYIANGQLILSEVSFGETQAAAAAQDEKAGERLSIYSPEAARERRVEIVEIKRL